MFCCLGDGTFFSPVWARPFFCLGTSTKRKLASPQPPRPPTLSPTGQMRTCHRPWSLLMTKRSTVITFGASWWPSAQAFGTSICKVRSCTRFWNLLVAKCRTVLLFGASRQVVDNDSRFDMMQAHAKKPSGLRGCSPHHLQTIDDMYVVVLCMMIYY